MDSCPLTLIPLLTEPTPTDAVVLDLVLRALDTIVLLSLLLCPPDELRRAS